MSHFPIFQVDLQSGHWLAAECGHCSPCCCSALPLIMPATASPSTPAATPKKKINAAWREGVPNLPASNDALERAALAGAMLTLAAGDSELTRGQLTKQAYKAVGSRTNKAEAVLANLEYCEDNDKDYDPASKYGQKTGPVGRAEGSPEAPARARAAMKLAGPSIRDGVGHYNVLAEEDGGRQIGDRSTRLLANLAGMGPDGIRAVKRPKLPMFTAANKTDRLSMAKVINQDIDPKEFRPYFKNVPRCGRSVRKARASGLGGEKTVLPPMASACKYTFILTE